LPIGENDFKGIVVKNEAIVWHDGDFDVVAIPEDA
jgi:hypothetical protein